MTMYLTKVWGLDNPVAPLQFGIEGHRNNARKNLKPGDLVVLVATVGENTADEFKGKLLGIVEPTNDPIMSLDYEVTQRLQDFNEDREYKWPYALRITKAWAFSPPLTFLSQISDRRFNMDSAAGIVPLTAEEEAQVLSLQRFEIPIVKPRVAVQARLDKKVSRNSPPPTTTRRGIMHLRRETAFTYAMRIVGANTPSYKIGWAFDYEQRAKQFNHSAMHQLGGLKYEPELKELLGSARDAYRFEQDLLRHFSAKRHSANHEIICGVDADEMRAAWAEHFPASRVRR